MKRNFALKTRLKPLTTERQVLLNFIQMVQGCVLRIGRQPFNHGTPGTIARSFKMDEALIILAGHRLKSHELPISY